MSPATNHHELRSKERWILLRTIELLARMVVRVQDGKTPDDCGWDVTAAIAYSQATVEYDATEVKS
jgi:hypothetical protein